MLVAASITFAFLLGIAIGSGATVLVLVPEFNRKFGGRNA